jgi:hypothetical protein
MNRIRFVLKSGRQLFFNCEEATIKTMNNTLTGYSLKGIGGSRPLFICMEEIAAIIDDGEPEDAEDDA